MESCSFELAWYWRAGRWTRDKLRGAALSDDDLADFDRIDILRAPFRRGWMVETIAHDGEWCDPVWPVYQFHTTEPTEGRAWEASWLEMA